MIKRGRFAPTPSGELHIGNAFAALASWLQIRQSGGTYVLRIEDIDKPRSRPAFAKLQQEDLRWLGIDWDEGPNVGGAFAPYEQSKRELLYEAALRQLQQSEHLYPCYCSRAELAMIASAPHGLSSEGAAYPGICRHLSTEERASKEIHKSPSLRFIMPDQPIVFDDQIRGVTSYKNEELGDFVIKRADGVFSYQLAVVVDDAAMAVTDVLRGADLLDSTPRQLALYKALSIQPPRFAHIPLLGDEDGHRLSKRDKSLTLAALREDGVKPERLVGLIGYIAGWLDELRPMAAQQLIPHFSLDSLPLRQQIISISKQQLGWLRKSD